MSIIAVLLWNKVISILRDSPDAAIIWLIVVAIVMGSMSTGEKEIFLFNLHKVVEEYNVFSLSSHCLACYTCKMQ